MLQTGLNCGVVAAGRFQLEVTAWGHCKLVRLVMRACWCNPPAALPRLLFRNRKNECMSGYPSWNTAWLSRQTPGEKKYDSCHSHNYFRFVFGFHVTLLALLIDICCIFIYTVELEAQALCQPLIGDPVDFQELNDDVQRSNRRVTILQRTGFKIAMCWS